ncbi:MAG: GDSL-type esterase/lipase family protein [Verrucomicrobia bacterium]|nr:GDSL-type esterase/lipase family protein [Verrucomicrobiota bacterium]
MKFPATIALASLVFTAAGIADPAEWEKSIAAFEQADRDHPPQKGGIVFTGSSTIARWKTLANSFPGFRVVNRGFGGSQMEDSMVFAERILVAHEPAAVVIFAGSNDINAGKSPDVVVENFKAFVAKVRAALPKTEIRYIEITSSPSRWAQRDKVIEANRLISAFCKEASLLGDAPAVHFIAVREKLLGTNGEPREELFEKDRLHPNADGYKIFADTIRPFLPKTTPAESSGAK